MDLSQASKFGTYEDVINMVQIQLVLFYFVIPFVLVLLVIYFRNRYFKKDNKEKEKEKIMAKSKTKHGKSKDFPTTDVMLKMLDDIEEPIVKSDYKNLAIEFDKKGKIIKEANKWQQEQ